jgi:hypothetical protein
VYVYSYDAYRIADSVSIDTLILEELCVNENATVLSNVDAESMQGDNAECAAIESTNVKDISEKVGAHVASLASADSIGANVERASSIDNDVEMRETHWEETRESQEAVKAQACYRTVENPLKHSIAKNTQGEIEAKRIRLQREDGAESSDMTDPPQPSTVVEEVDLTTSVPKIAKIETVHYDVASIKSMPKCNVQRSNLAIATNTFSPGYYECCNESNMSSLDQDFMKGRNSRVLKTLSRLSCN